MYISVSNAAKKFNISQRRVQILCEQGRIDGANMINGIWLIPETATKPADLRKKHININLFDTYQEALTIDDVCQKLSISKATAKNWIRLNKLIPDLNEQLFSYEYIEKFMAEIKSSDNTKLKSRRNKKSTAGKFLYKDYIYTESNQILASELLELGIINNEKNLLIVLANFAVQLYYQSHNIPYSDNYVLFKFLSQNHNDDFHILIRDLLGNHSIDTSLIEELYPALTKKITFVKGEDSLGLIYISLRDIGQRKKSGAYYTPEKVVNKLIEKLYETDKNLNSKTILDPCCGTGNFLLNLIAKGINSSNIYGQDIDAISVYLSRINIALTTSQISAVDIRSRIIIGNTLFKTFTQKFDVILGNPPWGSNLSEEDSIIYRQIFKTAAGTNIESYDLFVEKSLNMLSPKGILSFVLPEAILSVTAHDTIRKIMIDTCSFKFVSYLGNVFSGVQCPAIILGITPDNKKTIIGCKVTTENNKFVISHQRIFYDNTLSLNISDEENQCLDAICSIENVTYLKGNAKFALGIVTGNNKEYISSEKKPDTEIILKGSNIQRYSITNPQNYIRFVPKFFQQVAPVEMYRAKEKLLYRFISEVPVFAYDDHQTLSLNSCNIVIPEIDGLEIKYVLAILNSRVTTYFIKKKFNSIKLLRSHIEQIPIPVVSKDIQVQIIKKVDHIMNSSENISGLYEDLDNDIMALYRLNVEQIKTIQTALSEKNLFIKGNK